MINVFGTYTAVLRRISRVSRITKNRNFTQLVASVESGFEMIALPKPAEISFFLAHGSLWKLHSGFRKNMCLYYTMICLAHELFKGSDPEVNVCISIDNMDSTDGHCWLTLNGRVIHRTPLQDNKGYGQMFTKHGRIRYWLRNAKVEPNIGHNTVVKKG